RAAARRRSCACSARRRNRRQVGSRRGAARRAGNLRRALWEVSVGSNRAVPARPMMRLSPIAGAAVCLLAACTLREVRQPPARRIFGRLPSPDGPSVDEFTLTNAHGIEVRAITYGAIITVIRTPDRSGKLADIVFGFDSLQGYLAQSPYFGAIVGRFANRIARGQFGLDGVTYHLATNNGPNSLHGGLRGFDKVLWTAEPVQSDSGAGVVFHYLSPNGEEGYPGNVDVRVTYILTPRDELVVDYTATTDKATPLNLSQHSYWNLHGHGEAWGGVRPSRRALSRDAAFPRFTEPPQLPVHHPAARGDLPQPDRLLFRPASLAPAPSPQPPALHAAALRRRRQDAVQPQVVRFLAVVIRPVADRDQDRGRAGERVRAEELNRFIELRIVQLGERLLAELERLPQPSDELFL